jgi:hypothetical protein
LDPKVELGTFRVLPGRAHDARSLNSMFMSRLLEESRFLSPYGIRVRGLVKVGFDRSADAIHAAGRRN